MRNKHDIGILARVVLVYVAFSALWILVSDIFVQSVAGDLQHATNYQSVKGLLFVAASAAVIFFLLRQELSARRAAEYSREAVTEEKDRTYRELRSSEARYRSLFEHSLDALLITSPEGQIHAANPAACRIFGRTEGELRAIGRNGVVERTDFRLEAFLRERERTGKAFGTITMVRRDGATFEGEISSSVFETPSGKRSSMIVRDITERKQIEEERRISQEQFRSFVEQSSEGIYLFESNEPIPITLAIDEQIKKIYEGQIIECNDSLARMYGYMKAEDLKGVSLAELHGGTDKPENIEFIRSWIKADYRITNAISSEVDKDGNPVWFRNNLIGTVENGLLKRVWGTQIDITEIKKIEVTLQQSNAFLDSIVENIPHMIFIKTANDLRFIRFNRAGEDLLGWHRDDFIGKNDYDFFPKEQADFFIENDRKVLRSKEMLDIPEESLQTLHKGVRILHTKKIPVLDENGEPKYLLGVSEDITESKLAEEERQIFNAKLMQAQKLESIGTLAGGIAHDFNNILSSIIGFTEIVLDDIEKGSKVEYALQEVYSAGKRAKDLVKQILTIARKSDEEIKPVKAKTIVKEVLKFLRSSIPTTIEIQQKLESESSIMGNETQLHQILMNLCTNAAQAMEDNGGILKVVLEDVRFEKNDSIQGLVVETGEYIKLEVSDTGSGISPEVIGSIFDPYYTTKEIGKGTGLGLALVHGIVEKYNGGIEVSSELGVGSKFSIYLPITKTRQNSDPYLKKDIPTGSERILVVDDETSIAKLYSEMLEIFGYSVIYRTSSIKALELFHENPDNFDLVITDMTMPKMTGDKLIAELKKIRQNIPVILCSGYNNKISDETASVIGCEAFAYKPVDMADLVKTVRKVLDESKTKSCT